MGNVKTTKDLKYQMSYIQQGWV